MRKYAEIYLIGTADTAASHGVFEQPQRYRKSVLAEIRSTGMNESWQMKNLHLISGPVFVLTNEEMYSQVPNCNVVEYNGKKYEIQRTYVEKTGEIKIVTTSQVKDR